MTNDNEHKCTDPYAVIRRLREWETEQKRKWGTNWENNPDRPVSLLHEYGLPPGIDNVIISGSKVTDNSISLREWLSSSKKQKYAL